MNGAQALVDCLIQEGVDTVFGIPGSKFLEALDAMLHRNDRIRFITTRHEQGAAFMAMGYALARRGPGVCYATLGPGTTNLVTGIADARKNAVPVVALGGMMSPELTGRDGWQEIDQTAVMAPVTKESLSVPRADGLPVYLRRAFRTATSHLPGPVYLGIPVDHLAEEIPYEPLERTQYRTSACPDVRIPADGLDRIVERLAAARAPVILVGREVRWEGTGPDVLALAEKLGVPVATTAEGHGALPTNHPLVLGPTGKSGWPPANACLRGADLVLALGVKFDLHGTGFGHDFLPKGAALVHVSRFPEFLGANFPMTHGVQAPVPAFVAALGARDGGPPTREPAPWPAEVADWRRTRDEQTEALRRTEPLKPHWIATALRPYAVAGSFFAFDGGNFKKFLVKNLELQAPDLLFKDDGYGCVGSALPTALGYQAARPEARVFCATGDMGYLLNGGELETAVRENLPVVTLVFNDRGLGNIREYQKRKFAGRHIGVDYAPVDYASAARAFGAHGETVTHPDEVEPALRRAVDAGRPAVLDFLVDPEALAPK